MQMIHPYKIIISIILIVTSIAKSGQLNTSSYWNDWYLQSDSTLWVYGKNTFSSATARNICPHPDGKESPMQCGSDKWLQISAHGERDGVLAVKSDGTLWSWGMDSDGFLGPHGSANTPTQIGSAQWIFISLGFSNAAGIQNDSTLWFWGNGRATALPSGSTPSQISTDTWISVTTIYDGLMAIKSDSTLWAIGKNDQGELGPGDQNPLTALTQIGTDKWATVFGDQSRTYGIKMDSTLWGWGSNSFGFIDSTQNINSVITTPVQKTSEKFIDVYTSNDGTIVLKADSSLWHFGYCTNSIPSNCNERSTMQLVSANHTVSRYSLGAGSAHFITNDGTLYGLSSRGYSNTLLFPDLVPINTGSIAIHKTISSYYNSFILGSDSLVYGWGRNRDYILGDTLLDKTHIPVKVSDKKFIDIFTNNTSRSLLGLMADSTLWGIGNNDSNALGQADTLNGHIFEFVNIGGSTKWQSAFSGYRGGVAIDEMNRLHVWGLDDYSRMGLGSGHGSVNAPTLINNGISYTEACMSEYAIAALASDSTLYAWGLTEYGAGLDGTGATYHIPTQQRADLKWLDIDCDWESVVLRSSDSTLWIAGEYQSAFGVTPETGTAVQLGTTKWLDYTIFDNETIIALALDSTIWGIGKNQEYIFSQDSAQLSFFPWTQLSNKSFVSVENAYDGYIAVDTEGVLWGAGENYYGIMGVPVETYDGTAFIIDDLITLQDIPAILLNEDFTDTAITIADYYSTTTGFSVTVLNSSANVNVVVSDSTLILQSVANANGDAYLHIQVTTLTNKVSEHTLIPITIIPVNDTSATNTQSSYSLKDTLTTLDSIIDTQLDTLITTIVTEHIESYSVITTDSLIEGISYSLTHDTTVTPSVNELSNSVTTLSYDPVHDVTFTTSTTLVSSKDTSMTTDSHFTPTLDTVITTTYTQFSYDTTFTTIDSLLREVLYFSHTDTSILIDTLVISSRLDTLNVADTTQADTSNVASIYRSTFEHTGFKLQLFPDYLEVSLHNNAFSSLALYSIDGKHILTFNNPESMQISRNRLGSTTIFFVKLTRINGNQEGQIFSLY